MHDGPCPSEADSIVNSIGSQLVGRQRSCRCKKRREPHWRLPGGKQRGGGFPHALRRVRNPAFAAGLVQWQDAQPCSVSPLFPLSRLGQAGAPSRGRNGVGTIASLRRSQTDQTNLAKGPPGRTPTRLGWAVICESTRYSLFRLGQ